MKIVPAIDDAAYSRAVLEPVISEFRPEHLHGQRAARRRVAERPAD
jgi:hypothetical protein